MVGALPRSGQRLNPKSTIPLRLYQAEITHKHGTDIYTEATQEALDRRIAAYCRDNWGDWRDGSDAGDDETDPQTLSDEEVTKRYFDAMEGEYVEESHVDVEIPVAQLNLPAPARSQPSAPRGGVRPRARKQPLTKSRPDQGTAENARKALLTQLGFKNYALNDEQRDVILAALRLWQSKDKDQIADEIIWIAESDRDEPLSDEDIDLLCETLNSEAEPLSNYGEQVKSGLSSSNTPMAIPGESIPTTIAPTGSTRSEMGTPISATGNGSCIRSRTPGSMRNATAKPNA
jgi:hypothetical protein